MDLYALAIHVDGGERCDAAKVNLRNTGRSVMPRDVLQHFAYLMAREIGPWDGLGCYKPAGEVKQVEETKNI